MPELLARPQALAPSRVDGLRIRGGVLRRGGLPHLLHQAVGLVFVPPVVGREPPRRNELPTVVFLENDVAAEVAQRRFEHIENELRPRGAANLASARRGGGGLAVLGLGEVLQRLLRRAEEDQLAPAVQHDRFVEHLEDPRGGLVDRHEHDLVVRHVADDLHDVLGILGAEPARGLVEKVDVGRADHVESDVQPLALAAAENLAVRGADDRVAALVEPEFGELAVDPSHALPLAEVRGPDGGGEVQVLLDREVLVERVVLRDVGDILPHGLVARVEGEFIE